MEIFYLILVVILFLLAVSDLIVGVSNDAVNFLNSAIGSKAGSFKVIMIVAGLGIFLGAIFSSGMMEVARKGIFNPQYFHFSEIMILFLAVMITDVILLDVFNTYGMPTSTTVSIVFELLGAAVAISVIKVYINSEGLPLYEYINSAKALAIISGILLSVVIAFTAGVIFQYLSKLLFSFDYEKRLKYYGALWGGVAIAALTYFILIKGVEGTSILSEQSMEFISANVPAIMAGSFIGGAIILQIVIWFTRVDILKFIVLLGTFALAMAFAGNDLVNFIGVPLAGYNSYQLYTESGAAAADNFLMQGLAGKVPTPTLLLLLSGVVMVITLWTSRKARSVVKTSIDLGRQEVGFERFPSSLLSRSIVRSFASFAISVNNLLPEKLKKTVEARFDERPFIKKQSLLGHEAPSFDLIRASVTLIVASILIALGTSMKLPLSTTYVTFMVFMGASLADGAWGRESAVYRVTGVFSVVGGWFFTALSAFTIAFIIALIFYFGGYIAIGAMLIVAVFLIYRTHKVYNKRLEDQLAFEKDVEEGMLSKAKIVELSAEHLEDILGRFNSILDDILQGLADEDLSKLNATYKEFETVYRQTENLKYQANKTLDRIADDELHLGHFYILVVDYLMEMANNVRNIVKPSLNHVDNNHKPLLPVQLEELRVIQELLKERFKSTIRRFKNYDQAGVAELLAEFPVFIKAIRVSRKNQIKRIKNHEIGTRNSVLFLNHLGEFRNLGIFSNRLVKVFEDLIINPEGE